jgi:UTP--glucose-1-phosphate uridylyltransferase
MNLRGVIVAAGYGTRFLPITRTIPKEMLPLVDRPCLDFIIEEFVEAGIEEVLVITSRRKKALDDWFDRDPELEAALERSGNQARLERARPTQLRVQFVRQQQMGGTGDALRLARDFAGRDPVVVAFPDDLFFGGRSASAQLAQTHATTGCSVLGACDLGGRDVSAYGVIELEPGGDELRVRRVVEKPAPGTAPSSLISVGRYLYTPDFFEALEASHSRHAGGEFHPMEAIEALAGRGRMVARILAGERHDTGTPLGYLQAVFEQALSRPDLASAFRSWAEDRLNRPG